MKNRHPSRSVVVHDGRSDLNEGKNFDKDWGVSNGYLESMDRVREGSVGVGKSLLG